MRSLATADLEVAVWWGTVVECWATLARRRREGSLSADGEETARATLAALRRQWYEVAPTEAVRALSDRLLRLHGLRAGDALQLAAALDWTGNPPAGDFVTLDRRLREVARLEGLSVLP